MHDPNEEARLLEVINAVGIDRFNRRIRQLPDIVRQAETPGRDDATSARAMSSAPTPCSSGTGRDQEATR